MGGTSTDVFLCRCRSGRRAADARIHRGRRARQRAHARHSYRRGRRRIDCPLRCRRHVARGARVGRRGAGPDLLWPRNHAHRHRRQPAAGTAGSRRAFWAAACGWIASAPSRSCASRRARSATRRGVRRRHSPRGGDADGESHPRDLRRARPRSARNSRWWPSAAEGRCMPARWRALCAFPRVLVPAMPGALSAVGILLADAVRDYSRTVMLPGDAIENLERHLRGAGAARRRRVCRRGPAGCGAAHAWTCAIAARDTS